MTIWVAFKLGSIPTNDQVHAALTLKALCEMTGVSYNTAKTGEHEKMYLKDKEKDIWMFYKKKY